MASETNSGRMGVFLPGLFVVAVGIALGGWFVGEGFRDGRKAARVVTVKGLAERTVEADLAVWPIAFVAAGADVREVQARIGRDADAVRAFLARAGIAPDAISIQGLAVTDRRAQRYGNSDVPASTRFIVSETLLVRTADVAKVAAANQSIGDLVEAGVVLGSDSGRESSPSYLFTRLNTLKPAMIAEATANARKTADQFARDSDTSLGGIRRANQGVFQILPRDPIPGIRQESQVHKTVRVVSTIEYLLAE